MPCGTEQEPNKSSCESLNRFSALHLEIPPFVSLQDRAIYSSRSLLMWPVHHWRKVQTTRTFAPIPKVLSIDEELFSCLSRFGYHGVCEPECGATLQKDEDVALFPLVQLNIPVGNGTDLAMPGGTQYTLLRARLKLCI
ncbi:conserved hypothetical protein [Coccidioides posadasii str. Silveira]|uniref:Uncharacterized protein n=1 Tax=Coccidioides posadasii (strain RMSCC 757 / Silveira) TaxID=443226 RepID=E9D1X7_COCPS|nr:conserved hypothetical protein [Coccidioides posadasii str. Silveira]